MTGLERMYLGNALDVWIGAIGAAIVSTIVLLLARKILVRRLGAFARKTETTLDDLVVDLLAQTRFFTLVAVGLYVGAELLTLAAGVEKLIQKILILVFLLQGIQWGSRLIKYWLDGALKQRVAEDAASAGTVTAIGFVAKLALWATAVLLALDNLGFNISTLVAGLGIGGVALALAVQNILGDIFASLSIVLDKPFVLGDFIVVDEHLGTIEYIGLKTTRIRSLSGEQIIFSNSELLKSRIRNFKRMAERRVAFMIGVTYDTPLGKLKSIGPAVRDIINAQAQTRLDRVHFKEYGDSALIYEIVYYVLSPDYNLYMDIQQSINFSILEKFTDEGIDFAFPTMTIMKAEALTKRKDSNQSVTHSPMTQGAKENA